MSCRPESVLRKRPGVEASRLGQDLVILDSEGVMLRGLNGTGARVWELLDGTRSARQIGSELAPEFGQPPPVMLDDVIVFLNALHERKLIEPSCSVEEGGAP